MEDNDMHLLDLDVRRMISFGVIKGFLRRVYAYPVVHFASLDRECSEDDTEQHREARGRTKEPKKPTPPSLPTFPALPPSLQPASPPAQKVKPSRKKKPYP